MTVRAWREYAQSGRVSIYVDRPGAHGAVYLCVQYSCLCIHEFYFKFIASLSSYFVVKMIFVKEGGGQYIEMFQDVFA